MRDAYLKCMRLRVLLLAALSCGPRSTDGAPPPPNPPPVGHPPPYLGQNIVSIVAWPIQGMALDDTTLYYMAAGTLRAIPKNGGLWRTLASGESPTSTLAVSSGFVWWMTSSDIRRIATTGGAVEIVRSGVTARPPLFAVVGATGFYVDASTDRLMDTSGAVIADADGAPWGLASFTGRLYLACPTSIRTMLPDGSDVLPSIYSPPPPRRVHHHFAVTTLGPVFVDEDKVIPYGTTGGRQIIVTGETSVPMPNPVHELVAAGSVVYVLGGRPPPPKPTCNWFTDSNCPLLGNLDFAVHTVVVRVDLANAPYTVLTDAPFELQGLATDSTHVYFGRAANLLSDAEIDRIP